ncbi:MAG: endolytic transglycosylase MltG [Phormidesmis sp. RL_2_1]|nr:endolytic transglycosylase MltG [Phormidesmis sp. RL_2_1]
MRKRLFYIVLLALAAGAATQSWMWWSWASAPVSEAKGTAVEESFVQIQIPEGTPSTQIGQDLEAAGLIRSTTAWKLYSRWKTHRSDGGFQAGSYVISPTQSLAEIAKTIWDGDVVQLSFTIPEGWTRKQMAARFEQRGLTTADEFLAASENIPYDRFPWLPNGIPHLEGFLFPDTYQIDSGDISAEELVDMMLTRFEQVALPIYETQPSDYSLLDWVTLASIVEKEAVVADERDVIASVFARRLQEGITLGSDPTVEYGLGIEQTPENPLTFAQVETPNPYNTYINPGLTPTPIASPGAASLEASLVPGPTEFLYFVARYDGTHVFSRTLGEHEEAQGKIRDRIDAEDSEG